MLFVFVRIKDVFDRIIKKVAISRESEATMYIVSLLSKILAILHIITLLLAFMSNAQKFFGVQYTWIEGNSLTQVATKNYEIYIYGMYWSCTIMSTVGFGDITPISN